MKKLLVVLLSLLATPALAQISFPGGTSDPGPGSGSSGTVNIGVAGAIGYYTSSTAAIFSNANATLNALGALTTTGYSSPGFAVDANGNVTLGVSGSTTGILNMTGSTGGTITIKGQAAAGTYNFNLPITAGTAGNFLTSAGGGGSPMTWTAAPTSATAANIGTACGTDTQVVFVDSTACAGNAGLTFTKATGALGSSGNPIKLNGSTWALLSAGTTILDYGVSNGANLSLTSNYMYFTLGFGLKWSTGSYFLGPSDGVVQILNNAANSQSLLAGGTAAPVPTSCGTGSPIVDPTSTSLSGLVTMGTNAGGCVITFTPAFANAPYCTVTWLATPLASQSYVVSNAAITLTQTATSGNKVMYVCIGH